MIEERFQEIILIYLLTQLENIEVPNDSESIVELYFKYGIEGDIISSFTTAFGIKLYREDGEHLAYSEFIRRGESYLISLSNLKEIVKAQGVNNKIYVVENQMVFSYLCEILRIKKYLCYVHLDNLKQLLYILLIYFVKTLMKFITQGILMGKG